MRECGIILAPDILAVLEYERVKNFLLESRYYFCDFSDCAGGICRVWLRPGSERKREGLVQVI